MNINSEPGNNSPFMRVGEHVVLNILAELLPQEVAQARQLGKTLRDLIDKNQRHLYTQALNNLALRPENDRYEKLMSFAKCDKFPLLQELILEHHANAQRFPEKDLVDLFKALAMFGKDKTQNDLLDYLENDYRSDGKVNSQGELYSPKIPKSARSTVRRELIERSNDQRANRLIDKHMKSDVVSDPVDRLRLFEKAFESNSGLLQRRVLTECINDKELPDERDRNSLLKHAIEKSSPSSRRHIPNAIQTGLETADMKERLLGDLLTKAQHAANREAWAESRPPVHPQAEPPANPRANREVYTAVRRDIFNDHVGLLPPENQSRFLTKFQSSIPTSKNEVERALENLRGKAGPSHRFFPHFGAGRGRGH
jgi:hypothetical protein